MKSLNKVMLIGNLGKDPEMRRFDNDISKASFSLATTERYTNKAGEIVENTDWHNIVAWRGLATVCERYLKKGNKVYIEGRIRNRSWDAEDGTKKYITEIEAKELILLTPRAEGENQYGQNTNAAAMVSNPPPPPVSNPQADPVANNTATPITPTTPAANPATEEEDDLPF